MAGHIAGPKCHNYVMAVRATVDMPEPLHQTLHQRSQVSGMSVRSVIIHALEQTVRKAWNVYHQLLSAPVQVLSRAL